MSQKTAVRLFGAVIALIVGLTAAHMVKVWTDAASATFARAVQQ